VLASAVHPDISVRIEQISVHENPPKNGCTLVDVIITASLINYGSPSGVETYDFDYVTAAGKSFGPFYPVVFTQPMTFGTGSASTTVTGLPGDPTDG
jgi:hypothetical protein